MTGGDPNSHRGLEGLPAAYAAWRESTLGRVTDSLEQDMILDMAGPATGRRILDVGCGDGILSLIFTERGARVTGVDASPRMIAAARKRSEQHGKSVSFEIAEAEALPFEADNFDTVVAVTVLCFVHDAGRAVGEMARVLKPGGRLIIGELGRYNAWAAVRRIKGWLGSPVWRGARFRSPSELRWLVARAGLVEASVKGTVFYPPIGIAARLFRPIDGRIGACTTLGAAFLALAARKPGQAPEDGKVETARSR